MAQKAKKDRAKANASTLYVLHLLALTCHGLFLLANFVFRRRSLLAYIFFSTPSFICQFILETTGRPKYDASTKALKTAGEDLSAPGSAADYMFDVIWVTWGCLLLVTFFGNWAWLLWLVVPVFGVYKGYGMLSMARNMMGGGQGAEMPDQQQPVGNRKQRRAG
ncbi:hypothetical protein BJ875DRAFT_191356 [Amylocarpus encephaloides]|uniref:DUF788 domain-containing protein n=1 Tax=Amylocarpus encephaloides TaxID=45428 RepID=A0A9P7YNM8_9HELO|nr:hypothetical protein BJ875DRAFT_191356 [Amylocarpus encephaloides]